MTDSTTFHAMFVGLVFNQAGQPAEVSYVGSEAHYVILDDDFRRHVAARDIDRQVLLRLRELMEPFRDQAVVEMMRMMGKEDLFTKAMIDSSLKNWEQALGQPIPEDMRAWLGMLGFRVTVDVHGEVVDFKLPSQLDGEED
ncbi:MAG TPA: hypothetical protein VL334_06340 [Anaerolineae bacterium]|nr:hypothetical protein [Anaerolineae bacterium]